MDLSIFFAGTGGSVPSAQRGLPALLIRRGGEQILVDCGEGTQRQLIRSVGLGDIDCVLVTHFHADHWLGLPGMLKSFALRERVRPLTVYGPPGLKALMEQLRFVYGKRLPYKLNLVELGPTETVAREGYLIGSVPVRHKGESYGYALVEDSRPGHLDPALAQRLGVNPGPDFGRLQRGETVAGVRPEQVLGPTRPGRKLVISGDTAPCEALVVAAHESDLLVHESTFAQDESERARQTLHSTALQAAETARDAHVRMLAITHISSRYPGGELREQARAAFAGTVAPRDFDTIEIPFPERGSPRLVRWPDRRAAERSGGEGSSAATSAEASAATSAGAATTSAKAPAATSAKASAATSAVASQPGDTVGAIL